MLIIWDFDGVIFEAKWRNLFRAYETIIKTEGKNPRDFFGNNIKDFKNWWRLGWQKNNQEIGIRDWANSSKIFYEIYNSGLNLFPWTIPVIENLAKEHNLAVLTNRHKADAEKYLFPIRKYFLCITGCEDIKKLKPDPEGVNQILVKTGMTGRARKYTLIIGDESGDVKAGIAADIKVGIVKWGLGDWNQLLSLNPDYAFEKYEDLLEI